jgi:hypothetical protein
MSNEELARYAQLHQGTPIARELEAQLAQGGQAGPEEDKQHKYYAKKERRVCHRAQLSSTGEPVCPLCPVCKGKAWITFDSKAEAHRYDELLLMQKAGEISNLELQVRYALHCPDILHGTSAELVSHYFCDFRYIKPSDRRTGMPARVVVEDVKGVATPMYRLKKKWLRLEYGIIIKEVRRESKSNEAE